MASATAWEQLPIQRSIVNDSNGSFEPGDIVRIEFGQPPHGVGKLVEIRRVSEAVAVVQW